MSKDPIRKQQKQETRTRIRATLAAMTAEDRHEESAKICTRLESLDAFRHAQTVMMYMPLPQEVDVLAIAIVCFQQGKSVCVPRVNWQRREMTPVEVNGLNDDCMDLDEHGIRTPREGEVVLPELIDLVIIPGIAFDTCGNRLGRGAGYYDRFLSRLSRRTAKIGVAFERQILGKVPMGDKDVRVDVVVTNRRVTKSACRVR